MFEQIRAQRVRLALMRLAFVGIVVLSLLLILWALPWIPFGMTADAYDARVSVALLLGLATWLASLLFVIIWGPHFRNESLPEFLRVLFGAQQLIRGRNQFYSRLSTECARSRKDRRRLFSLIVLRLPADGTETLEPLEGGHLIATMLVRSMVRSEDVVGDTWPQEVWVLSMGAGPQACAGIMRRLAQSLAHSDDGIPSLGRCRIGGSVFGQDGEDPESLLSVAHRRLVAVSALLDDDAA